LIRIKAAGSIGVAEDAGAGTALATGTGLVVRDDPKARRRLKKDMVATLRMMATLR
jgi:hypothetical protein